MAGTLSLTGGTLFGVATQQFGDFTGWWLLCQANGTKDPWLHGLTTIAVPDWSPALSGGLPPQQ